MKLSKVEKRAIELLKDNESFHKLLGETMAFYAQGHYSTYELNLIEIDYTVERAYRLFPELMNEEEV